MHDIELMGSCLSRAYMDRVLQMGRTREVGMMYSEVGVVLSCSAWSMGLKPPGKSSRRDTRLNFEFFSARLAAWRVCCDLDGIGST